MAKTFSLKFALFEIWARAWQNLQKWHVRPAKTDQLGHLHSLIRVFAVHMKKAWVLSYSLGAQQRFWSDWSDFFFFFFLIWVLWSFQEYCIRPNYRTCSYKSTVKQFSNLKDYNQFTFYLLLYKNICCGYSFELPRLVEAFQTSIHNICFYKENRKYNRISIIKYAPHEVLCWSVFKVCPY